MLTRRTLVSGVVAAPLAIALGRAQIVDAAQEASPAAAPGDLPGVTIEPLGLLEVLPGLAVPVVRVELAPGAAVPPHTSPGPAVARVEAGQVTYSVATGAARRARLTVLDPSATPVAATPGAETAETGTPTANGTPTARAVEAIAVVEEDLIIVGEETSLSQGEGVAFGPDVIHSFSNTGNQPAVLLIVGEIPPDQPPFRFDGAEAGATPSGTPEA